MSRLLVALLAAVCACAGDPSSTGGETADVDASGSARSFTPGGGVPESPGGRAEEAPDAASASEASDAGALVLEDAGRQGDAGGSQVVDAEGVDAGGADAGGEGDVGLGPDAVERSPTTTGGSGGGTGLVTGACGARAYTAYVPLASVAGPTPVLIATHGYGDTASNFANTVLGSGWKAAADEHGFIALFVATTHPSEPTFLHRTATGELDWPSTAAEIEGVLACVYAGLGALYDVDTTALYWMGFSEGAVVADLAAWHLDLELRAAAPYAGGVSGKQFPVERAIPVYFVCGTGDPSYWPLVGVHQEWVTAGHPTQAAWVQGVGHSFSGLSLSGPSPSAVWTWMSTVPAAPVQPSYTGEESFGPVEPGPPPATPQGSGGSGGTFPGPTTRTVAVPGSGTHTYHLYAPSACGGASPVPLLVVLHGAGGAGTAPAAAAATRDAWAELAEAEGFVVVAPQATGPSGGWVPATDVAVLNAVFDDVMGAYDIELTRIYGWGFSAGGHFMHALGLQNAELFAGYGVSAGALAALAGLGAPATASRVIPVDIHIGTDDPLYPAVSQDPGAFQQAGWQLGTTLHFTQFAGGHTYTPAHLAEMWSNVQPGAE